ncbi:MAG: hypothetical protein KAH48_10030 [Chlorobi bacterium]|nr:hypothetical protein [Chlorobiota bacterium]
MKNISELTVGLQEFHGTELWYKHQTSLIHYTDGIKYLAENADCYWLIDLVASYQVENRVKNEPFQVFHLKVNENKTAKITISDGNDNILAVQEIEYSDFPLPEITVWCVDKIMLLPGEY